MSDPAKNFAKVVVSTGYDASATIIILSSSQGSKLPNPATDGAFNLVWWNFTDYPNPSDDPKVEIVRCTARSTDTLTITRNQENSGATTKNEINKIYQMILTFSAKVYNDIYTAIDIAERYEWNDKEPQTIYIYYGYSKTGKWKIKRKTNSTNVWGTAEGTGDYAIAWADKENKNYT